MKTTVGVIGGTGIIWEEESENQNRQSVSTPFGEVEVIITRYSGKDVVLLPRHGFQRNVAPHLINYRANIYALKVLGAKYVLATSAVGSLTDRLSPGSLALLTDFLDFTKARLHTFYDAPGELVHTDFSKPYSEKLNKVLVKAARESAFELNSSAVYVCVEGPRFETPAEIRMFRILGGDVVGMTGVPEVVLAREANISYSSIAIITNWAAGISPRAVSHEEVLEMMAKRGDQVRDLIRRAVEMLE